MFSSLVSETWTPWDASRGRSSAYDTSTCQEWHQRTGCRLRRTASEEEKNGSLVCLIRCGPKRNHHKSPQASLDAFSMN